MGDTYEVEVKKNGNTETVCVSEEDYIRIQKEKKAAGKRKKALITGAVFAVAILFIILATGFTACESGNRYESEVNGKQISEDIKEQRPVAILTDEETEDGDIVYEFISESGASRLVLIKDWKKIKALPCASGGFETAKQIVPEWNAVLISDGAAESMDYPYIDELKTAEVNGKDLHDLFSDAEIQETYNSYRVEGTHFGFEKELTEAPEKVPCTTLTIDNRNFTYDEKKKEYISSEDKDDRYANIILQNAVYLEMGDNSFFNLNDINRDAWLIRGGSAIPLTWAKLNDLSMTSFYNLDGNKITLTPGRTYIGIVDDRLWENVVKE